MTGCEVATLLLLAEGERLGLPYFYPEFPFFTSKHAIVAHASASVNRHPG